MYNRSVGEPAEGSLQRSVVPPGAAFPPTLCEHNLLLRGRPCRFDGERPRRPSNTASLRRSLSKLNKTFNNGSLGSGIDEERSEMR